MVMIDTLEALHKMQLIGMGPTNVIEPGLVIKPIVSMINVSPSYLPTDSPHQLGFGSLVCSRFIATWTQ